MILPARRAIEIKACDDAKLHQIAGFPENFHATGNRLSVASSAARSQAETRAVERPGVTLWETEHIALPRIRGKDQCQLPVSPILDRGGGVFAQCHHYIVAINDPVTRKRDFPEVRLLATGHIRIGVLDVEDV